MTNRPPPPRYPSKGQIRAAKRFAATRSGSVSFAVIGRAGGKKKSTSLHGRGARMQFSSASVTKSMLLAAYLRSHKHISGSAKAELKPMIEQAIRDGKGKVVSEE